MSIDKPNIKTENGVQYIFCAIRKKWLVLTPEEKVRQYIIHQLVHTYQYPLKYISVEKTITVNTLKKRYDILVFNTNLQAKILIECKADTILLDEKTLMQIATYNLPLQVPYLMVSNGNKNYYFHLFDNKSTQINTLPKFEEL